MKQKRGILKWQNIPQKQNQLIEYKVCFTKKLDLSNEVLYISVDQETAKISAVKIGGQKKIATNPDLRLMRRGSADRADYFSTFNFDF